MEDILMKEAILVRRYLQQNLSKRLSTGWLEWEEAIPAASGPQQGICLNGDQEWDQYKATVA